MCGFVGFTGINNGTLQKLNKILSHRGPDDAGHFSCDYINFAQSRLSILDLSNAGHQPMFYEPSTGACSEKFHSNYVENAHCGIVFNGEIYNFLELKKELSGAGYVFKTECDTELVLAAYTAWGTNCVKRFNGMWAFCIFDRNLNQLFLSRDRLGIKPLYYYAQKEFIFGSELKVFLEFPQFSKNIDTQSLDFFFTFQFTPPEKTILKDVKKLSPGTNLLYDLQKKQILNIEQYWKLCFEQKRISIPEIKEQIKYYLNDSVRIRMMSDVPVGAFLSGGIDSSIIVQYMRKHVARLKTFSVGFDYKDFNETQWSRQVAAIFDTEHTEIICNHSHVKLLIEKLPQYFDDPFGDQSAIPTFLVSQIAAKEISVVLSGTGGDELFGGYRRHYEFLVLQEMMKLPSTAKKIISSFYKLISNDKAGKLGILLAAKDYRMLYLQLFSHLFRNQDDLKQQKFPLATLLKYFYDTDLLSSVLSFDQQIYLPDDLLMKEDRATMANSLEGRLPFLDYRLVELANSLPANVKIRHGETKWILKKAFEDILPANILYRKKQGFGLPVKHYFRNELKDFVRERIFDFSKFNYFDKNELMKLWNLHQSEKFDYSPLFWNILMFNCWYEKWIS